MLNTETIDQIKKIISTNEGITEDQLRSYLTTSGWKKEEIAEAIILFSTHDYQNAFIETNATQIPSTDPKPGSMYVHYKHSSPAISEFKNVPIHKKGTLFKIIVIFLIIVLIASIYAYIKGYINVDSYLKIKSYIQHKTL